MNKALLLSLIFFTSCFSFRQEPNLVQSAPIRKQKHQIALLQKKLKSAETSQKKATAEVERVQEEMQQAQLTLIRKQVDRYEKQLQEARKNPQKWAQFTAADPSSLFLAEREDLHKILQTRPSPAAFDAQVELDRILRLITQLSDESKF